MESVTMIVRQAEIFTTQYGNRNNQLSYKNHELLPSGWITDNYEAWDLEHDGLMVNVQKRHFELLTRRKGKKDLSWLDEEHIKISLDGEIKVIEDSRNGKNCHYSPYSVRKKPRLIAYHGTLIPNTSDVSTVARKVDEVVMDLMTSHSPEPYDD